MSVIILAGGHGECMRLGDDYVPKLMISVGGKPLLEHHIEWLKAAGYDSIVLSLGVKADVVRNHFSDGSQWGVKLRYMVQQNRVGNADMVKALERPCRRHFAFPGDVGALRHVKMPSSPLPSGPGHLACTKPEG